MRTNMLIVAVGFAIFSCSNGRDSKSRNEISGIYVREYSFKVLNPESGSEIGMRTIRDTISIMPVQKGFQVSNRKWLLNDYDKEGWRSADHFEDRPWPTYRANFSDMDTTLNSDQAGLVPALYIDLSKQTVSKSKSGDQAFRKVR